MMAKLSMPDLAAVTQAECLAGRHDHRLTTVRCRIARLGVNLAALLAIVLLLADCKPSYRPGLPSGSPFGEGTFIPNIGIIQGIAAGDVTSDSAVVWFRTAGPAQAQVEVIANGASTKSEMIRTSEEHDFTATVRLGGLRPGTRYHYRILAMDEEGREDPRQDRLETLELAGPHGTFVTAPPDDLAQKVTFLWSGDLGGQQHCRRSPEGYRIFEHMRRRQPAFALLVGDLIYGDERCGPPNMPGSDFAASSLKDYRAKHRYQRDDPGLQRFLAGVPVWVIWDDHEVRNNFSGPHEPLTAVGRQALLEYWPIGRPAEEPDRLYRRMRYGADLELFILDTRQYRSLNSEQDGPKKTMLGTVQRAWLLEGLSRSTATWKVIVTSVPLSNPKGGTLLVPGNDSWARGADGTGFQTELDAIIGFILGTEIRNVVWLAADMHYAQVNAYDPDGDGIADFHEFICGPLSARPGQPLPPNSVFKPTILYSAGGFFNFGALTVDGSRLHVAIFDDEGTARFEHTVRARFP